MRRQPKVFGTDETLEKLQKIFTGFKPVKILFPLISFFRLDCILTDAILIVRISPLGE